MIEGAILTASIIVPLVLLIGWLAWLDAKYPAPPKRVNPHGLFEPDQYHYENTTTRPVREPESSSNPDQ